MVSKELAEKIAKLIEEETRENWQHYFHGYEEGYEVIIDEDAMVTNLLEAITNDLIDELLEHDTIKEAFKEAEITVEEIALDAREYDRLGPMAYYGMKQSDFI